MNPQLNRDIELLFEISSLRHMPRAWVQQLGGRPATVLDHSVRVMLISLVLARMEKINPIRKSATSNGEINEELIIKMALFHDLAESRTSDHAYMQKVYVEIKEELAVSDMYAKTQFSDIPALLKKYEDRDCIEAKIVRDADNIDVDLEIKEYENMGHKLPAKWKSTSRKIVQKSLYTKSAKVLLEKLLKSDPDSWHLKANKYYKIKNAAK